MDFKSSRDKEKDIDSLDRQQSPALHIPGYAHHILKEEISRQKSIQAKSQYAKETSVAKDSERILVHLEEVSQLEETVAQLTADATSKVLSTKSLNEIKLLTSLGRRGLDQNVEKTWSWLAQTLQMCEVHVQNASNYHQFQLCLEETQQALDKNLHKERLSKLVTSSNGLLILNRHILPSDALEDHLSHLMSLWRRVDRTLHLAHKAVPLKKRVTPLKEPCPGLWLGSHYSLVDRDCELFLNDALKILNNSDRLVWRVEIIRNGREVQIPSIGCLIPGPDYEAIGLANKLSEMLIDLWHSSCCDVWAHIYQLFLHLINSIHRNEVSMTAAVSQQVAEMLRQFDTVFARKMLPATDEWFSKLATYFEKVSSRRQPESGSKGSLNEGQVGELQAILKVFRLLIKHYAGLKKKIKQAEGGEGLKPKSTNPGRTRFPSDSSDASSVVYKPAKVTESAPKNLYPNTPQQAVPMNVTKFYWSAADYGSKINIVAEYLDNYEMAVLVPTRAGRTFTTTKEIQIEPTVGCGYISRVELSPSVVAKPAVIVKYSSYACQTEPEPVILPPPKSHDIVLTSAGYFKKFRESASQSVEVPTEAPKRPPVVLCHAKYAVNERTLIEEAGKLVKSSAIPMKKVGIQADLAPLKTSFSIEKCDASVNTQIEAPRPIVKSQYTQSDNLQLQSSGFQTDRTVTKIGESQTLTEIKPVYVHTSTGAPRELLMKSFGQQFESNSKANTTDFSNQTESEIEIFAHFLVNSKGDLESYEVDSKKAIFEVS